MAGDWGVCLDCLAGEYIVEYAMGDHHVPDPILELIASSSIEGTDRHTGTDCAGLSVAKESSDPDDSSPFE